MDLFVPQGEARAVLVFLLLDVEEVRGVVVAIAVAHGRARRETRRPFLEPAQADAVAREAARLVLVVLSEAIQAQPEILRLVAKQHGRGRLGVEHAGVDVVDGVVLVVAQLARAVEPEFGRKPVGHPQPRARRAVVGAQSL